MRGERAAMEGYSIKQHIPFVRVISLSYLFFSYIHIIERKVIFTPLHNSKRINEADLHPLFKILTAIMPQKPTVTKKLTTAMAAHAAEDRGHLPQSAGQVEHDSRSSSSSQMPSPHTERHRYEKQNIPN